MALKDVRSNGAGAVHKARWLTRAEAKNSARQVRRAQDRASIAGESVGPARDRYERARAAYLSHMEKCNDCLLARKHGEATDCKTGDELQTTMDHFALEVE